MTAHRPSHRLTPRPPVGPLPEHDLFHQPVENASIQARFEQFHAEHPEVYATLVELARRAKHSGRKVGMKALFERLRWEYAVERGDREFALNNVLTSRYARLLMEREPDLADFFTLRKLVSA